MKKNSGPDQENVSKKYETYQAFHLFHKIRHSNLSTEVFALPKENPYRFSKVRRLFLLFETHIWEKKDGLEQSKFFRGPAIISSNVSTPAVITSPNRVQTFGSMQGSHIVLYR